MSNDEAIYFDSNSYLRIGQNARLSDFVDEFLCSKAITSRHKVLFNQNNEPMKENYQLSTPLFLYSKRKLINNFLSYKNSFDKVLTTNHGIETYISYALKANFNPTILKLFYELGSWCSLVNINELKISLKLGFNGSKLIFNGNGKSSDEIELALKNKCFLNIDSLFNLKQTIGICKKLLLQVPAKLVIRINQSIDANVHDYLSTSVKSCKFGVTEKELDQLIITIQENSKFVCLAGLHVHTGSTIDSIDVYDKSIQNLVGILVSIKAKYKTQTLELINFGGGLGIDYYKYSNRTSNTENSKIANIIPSPEDLALTISKYASELDGIKVIVEPGRSLVGDTAILLTKLIGIKKGEHRNFMVVDASMSEIIRPCLYKSYHHIDFIKPLVDDKNFEHLLVDIVGPVCESGDFLGKDRYFLVPQEDCYDQDDPIYLAVMDVGAYCSSMSSNYNMRVKPSEILVDDTSEKETTKYYLIRKSETFDDLMQNFCF